ncbi:hydrogenase maturation nickel metallochaperone HypA [Novosphingobium sp. FSY-8]|uniref:Hydrogenase maturation factor HypA n=1 Tax=Novosphingobium ovatum TaxID=1908523 RepID=A0ABW9X9M2_9SPHN|nr:hydrogenase maturation nickel metallochaperone HypA [Novosphingobium ovatum]NBC35234.1 hydrogenase maturation nickel metallochaperone HypA [Novosphingobium ovatum]
MHEMAICESIRDILEEQAATQRFTRVERVKLAIGALSGVEAEAIRFGFDVAMAGSVADGARLEIEDVPGTAWCLPCAVSVTIAARYDACPKCGSHQLQVTGGSDMTIREVEVV